MSNGINKVTIIGRLGKDPEVRATEKGVKVANFSVATTETWKDKGTGVKKERTEWHRIVAWDQVAENCGKYLSKGRLVYIEGRLQTRSYEDKDKVKRWVTEIIVTDIQFLDKKRDDGANPPPPTDNDLPF